MDEKAKNRRHKRYPPPSIFIRIQFPVKYPVKTLVTRRFQFTSPGRKHTKCVNMHSRQLRRLTAELVFFLAFAEEEPSSSCLFMFLRYPPTLNSRYCVLLPRAQVSRRVIIPLIYAYLGPIKKKSAWTFISRHHFLSYALNL